MFRGKRTIDRGRAPLEALSDHVDAWEELAIDYLDGRVAPQTRAAIEAHLAGCPACASRLKMQRVAIDYLRTYPLKDAPPALRESIVSEALFPSRAVRTVRGAEVEGPKGWSYAWRHRMRPLLPASVVVAVALVALVGFAVLRMSVGGSDGIQSTTVADVGASAETTNAGSPMSDAGVASEEVLSAGSDTTTSPGVTATTMVSATTLAGDDGGAGTIKAIGPPIQERTGMIESMKAVEASPVYFLFAVATGATEESTPEEAPVADPSDSTQTTLPGAPGIPEDTLLTAKQAEAIGAQITALTGLEPLGEGLGLSRPTFAAYVLRDQAAQFIDLLRSIATSEGLAVGLEMQPSPAVMEWTTLLLERKTSLVVLTAQRVPQPAVSSWSFTTSTLLPSDETTGDVTTPDDAGTHVLVVILVNSLP